MLAATSLLVIVAWLLIGAVSGWLLNEISPGVYRHVLSADVTIFCGLSYVSGLLTAMIGVAKHAGWKDLWWLFVVPIAVCAVAIVWFISGRTGGFDEP